MNIDQNALRALLDKEAIREASLRYTRGIDRHDDEIAAQAYHPDATDDHGFYIGEALGFIKRAGAVHAHSFDVHHHYTMNQTIELEGDIAHVETYFLASLRQKSGPVVLIGGRYVDRFEKREEQWRIGHRTCVVEWHGELSPSTIELDPSFASGSWDQTDPSYRRPIKLDREPRDVRA